MTTIHPDLITMVDAVEMLSATSFRVSGHPREMDAGNGDGTATYTTLVSALADNDDALVGAERVDRV